MTEDCVFCKIAEKEADATVVYEDPHTLAFLDIHPLNPGHTLVIPKKHYSNMLEMQRGSRARLRIRVQGHEGSSEGLGCGRHQCRAVKWSSCFAGSVPHA